MSTHVFIVRPFGVKKGAKSGEINFDQVEADIIAPVLDARPDTSWGTTGPIVESGNIRADMMDLLLTADLVIADISIHNANVYYELGIRHALRHRPTILMRSRLDEVPFDLKTDRYLSSEVDEPEAAREALRQTIEATLSSDTVDSPVYNLIPSLDVRDGASYISLPREFAEAVELARRSERVGQLGLLGDEARVERWHVSGQRLVGRALMSLQAFGSASVAWERIRQQRPDDIEANLELATVYERQGELARSEATLTRVLNAHPNANDRAEALALRGRNLKGQWTQEWRVVDEPGERQRAALRSARLLDCLAAYRSGFMEDINHYYPGMNALAMSTIVIELAELQPNVWDSRFDSDDEPQPQLRRQRTRRDQLAAATALALDAAKAAARREDRTDPWLDLSLADHRFLTSDRVEFVAQSYRDAVVRVDDGFNRASAAAQILLFRDLGIFVDKAEAALAALGLPDDHVPCAKSEPRTRILVSSGHRVDEPGRPQPRFPDTKQAEDLARSLITAAIEEEMSYAEGAVVGMAGLANGNDILFHEIAADLGVETEAVLAMPEKQYLGRSVGETGTWPERFRRLCAEKSP